MNTKKITTKRREEEKEKNQINLEKRQKHPKKIM